MSTSSNPKFHRLSSSSSTTSLNSHSVSFDSPSNGGLPRPANSKTCMTAAMKRWRYLRRLFHYRQMDFEFAFWQMVYLLSNPKIVYKNFTYRKKTKAQFARDDPAFLVLLAGWLVVSSAGFAIVLGIGIVSFIKFLLYVIFVDCIGVGICIATILWFVSNKMLLKSQSTELDVEWGFCFDVHLNAFFPLLVILHFIQLFFYSILISKPWFIATLFGNTLWLVAIGYYLYITFLGYHSLHILERSKLFLYPFIPLILIYLGTLIANWNLTNSLMDFYLHRVL